MVPVKNSVTTGIAYDDLCSQLGLVSEYEERETAIFAGYPWTAWQELTQRERATAVAHRRVHSLVQLHSQDAVERESETRRKRRTFKR